MTCSGGCWRRRLAGLVLATSWLGGCATGGSEPAAVAVCPPVVEYSQEFQARAAGELELLPEGSAVVEMLGDYAVMREQARACRVNDYSRNSIREVNPSPRIPRPARILDAFARDAAARRDSAAIMQRIIADRTNRCRITAAQGHGRRPSWDYEPITDATHQRIRAGACTTVVDRKAHLPLRRG